MFYQGVPIYHFKHVPGPVAQSIAESEYNSSFTAVMSLAHFRMLNNEFLKKDPDVVPEQSPLIILGGKSVICMANTGKDTKNTIHVSIRIYFVINGEECTFHKIVRCERCMQCAYIVTKNGREG